MNIQYPHLLITKCIQINIEQIVTTKIYIILPRLLKKSKWIDSRERERKLDAKHYQK